MTPPCHTQKKMEKDWVILQKNKTKQKPEVVEAWAGQVKEINMLEGFGKTG